MNQARLYLKWFIRIHVTPVFDPAESLKYCTENLSVNIFESEWLDGLNAKLLLRKGAIAECLEYAIACDVKWFGKQFAKNCIVTLLKHIQKEHEIFELGIHAHQTSTVMTSQHEYTKLSKTFLAPSDTLDLPTIWWTPVYPKNKGKFLIHILLLFGQFETEYALMKTGNIRLAYAQAGLFDKKMWKPLSTIFSPVMYMNVWLSSLEVHFNLTETCV